MEGRAHAKEKYAQNGRVSFMDADFARCEEDMMATFRPRPATRARARAAAASDSQTGQSKPHVCVVGAGLAGLRCAQVLLAKGFRVTVLEAKDQIGGRVSQKFWNGGLVDVGASWMHGTDHNPLAELARATSTPIATIPDTTRVYSPVGKVLPADAVDAGLDRIWELISDAFRESNRRSDEIDPRKSLRDYFTDRLAAAPDSAEERELIMLQAEQWGGFIGDEWTKQSLRWFWLEECLDGDNLFVPGNHGAIINSIADPVMSHPDGSLVLSTAVTSITTTSTDAGDPVVSVVTARSPAGRPLIFDEAVVTVPLGCLKREYVTFSPALSPTIAEAVRHASISSFEKIYLAFPEPFWDRAEGTPCFVHFLTPRYLPAGQPAWSMELLTLSSADVYGADHAQPTVLVQTYGAPAAHIISLVRGLAPGSAEYVARLGAFFRPYLALLPGYDADDPACVPAAALATAWLDDRHGGHGSYTNFKTSREAGQEAEAVRLDDGVRAMRRGEPERGLWFAGEHTAPFLGLGTTTGAYWSGECAAMRIAAAHGRA